MDRTYVEKPRVMCELIHIQELVCVVCSVGSLGLLWSVLAQLRLLWKPFRVILHTLANARDKPGFIPPYSVLRASVLLAPYEVWGLNENLARVFWGPTFKVGIEFPLAVGYGLFVNLPVDLNLIDRVEKMIIMKT